MVSLNDGIPQKEGWETRDRLTLLYFALFILWRCGKNMKGIKGSTSLKDMDVKVTAVIFPGC